MRTSQILILLNSMFVSSGLCQLPDFSGVWKQVGATNQTRIDRIEHRGALVTVSFEIKSAISSIYAASEFRTDGTETYRRSATSEKWITVTPQGSSLVLSTVSLKDSAVTATRETWTLSGATTLTKVRRTVTARGVEEETLVFERQ